MGEVKRSSLLPSVGCFSSVILVPLITNMHTRIPTRTLTCVYQLPPPPHTHAYTHTHSHDTHTHVHAHTQHIERSSPHGKKVQETRVGGVQEGRGVEKQRAHKSKPVARATKRTPQHKRRRSSSLKKPGRRKTSNSSMSSSTPFLSPMAHGGLESLFCEWET